MFQLQKLLNDGYISEVVFDAAQVYFKAALNYILAKFPLSSSGHSRKMG